MMKIKRHLEDGHKINPGFVAYLVVSFVAPILAIQIGLFRGVTELSLFNAGNVLFLGVITILVMVVKTVQMSNDDNKIDFLIGMIVTTIAMLWVVYGLILYVEL